MTLNAKASAASWVARIAGTLMTLVFLAFLVGEGPPPLFRMNLEQNLHFLSLLALCAGNLLAWKWQGWGGAIAVAGFALGALLDRDALASPVYLIPAAAGVLHIVCWLRLRGAPPQGLPAVVWAALGFLVAFFGNEMFGNPPLMAGSVSRIAGAWRSQDEALTIEIQPGGETQVTLRGSRFPARIAANRSWFGRLLRWRSDYRISAKDMTAYLNSRRGELEGQVQTGRDRIRVTLIRTSP